MRKLLSITTFLRSGITKRVIFTTICLFLILNAKASTLRIFVSEFEGKEYLLVEDRTTQLGAQTFAERSLQGHLVVINSKAENDFVYSMVRRYATLLGTASDGGGATYIWLGGNDANIEGRWSWGNGEPFAYTNWGRAEPDNYLNQDGLAMGLENWPANRDSGVVVHDIWVHDQSPKSNRGCHQVQHSAG